MSIVQNHYNFIKPQTIQNSCACCCRNNTYQQPTTGIFGFGMSNNAFPNPMPMNNFGFNPFGFSSGFNFNMSGFSFLNNLCFDVTNFFKPLENLRAYMQSATSSNAFQLNFPPALNFSSFTPQTSNSSTIGNSSTGKTSGSRSNSTSVSATKKHKEQMKKEVGQNDGNFTAQLKRKNVKYNATLGHNIATSAINKEVGTQGQCADYVNTALEANGINAHRDGHAYTRASVLRRDTEHFTEVRIFDKDDLKELPAGSVVVYKNGVCSNPVHGHTFIATGNGGGVSDHFQTNLPFPENGEGISAFVPTTKIA